MYSKSLVVVKPHAIKHVRAIRETITKRNLIISEWIHRKHLIELFPRFPFVNIIAGEWYWKYQCEHSSDIRCSIHWNKESSIGWNTSWHCCQLGQACQVHIACFWLSVFVLINCIVVCHLHWLYLAIKCDFVEFIALYLQLFKYW